MLHVLFKPIDKQIDQANLHNLLNHQQNRQGWVIPRDRVLHKLASQRPVAEDLPNIEGTL